MSGLVTRSQDQESNGLAHGGRLAEARALFPDAPEPLVDLSTGINPMPYPISTILPQWLTRLPEPNDLAALQAAAAAAYGVVDPAMVVAAPGTQILIDLLPRLWSAESVAVLGPTYAEYRAAWLRVGCAVTEFRNLSELQSTTVAVICNPNNPDGRRIARSDILALADLLGKRGGLVLVDEAFADLEPPPLTAATALPHPGLIVLRSFGKTYGLAGIRLGFALASPDRAAAIRDALGPWAVSGVAVGIGRQALADRKWLVQTAQTCANAVERVDTMLAQSGICVAGGTRLFRLAECADAVKVFAQLGRAGVFVRRFVAYPRWLRFGLPGDEHAWTRLDTALTGGAARSPTKRFERN
ncbi:MAG: threonine-phosphate decarboxylase [Acetobacteraceae bacterium]|nr:threonine-phosphate decarboxylase [Acetobacteraceae bacterium]